MAIMKLHAAGTGVPYQSRTFPTSRRAMQERGAFQRKIRWQPLVESCGLEKELQPNGNCFPAHNRAVGKNQRAGPRFKPNRDSSSTPPHDSLQTSMNRNHRTRYTGRG